MQASLFTSLNRPYYIYGLDYSQKSAGQRALHHLCHALNELGLEAYLVGNCSLNPKLHVSMLTKSDLDRHIARGLIPVVIYPEVVSGNPWNAPYVVRWLLNKPGLLGGDTCYQDSDLLFCYSQDFVTETIQATNLRVPVIDESIFNNQNNPNDKQRNGTCFYANKYLVAGHALTDEVKNSVSLCQDVNLTRSEIAAILRKSELLYCYEQSAIITEAKLCGCPVVMIDTPYLSQHSEADIIGDGIAYGTSSEQLEHAKATVNREYDKFQQVITDSWGDIHHFVNLTQTHFQQSSQQINSNWYLDIQALLKGLDNAVDISTDSERLYQNRTWLKHHGLSEGRVSVLAERMTMSWQCQPTFHLLIVVNAHEVALLSDTLDSLGKQLYGAWGLTVLSDSTAPEAIQNGPENIEWLQVEDDLNDAINAAVNESGLDWVMQLLPGDQLEPHALLSFADSINRQPDVHLFYSDEVANPEQYDIWFKPDFNLELLRSQSYLGRSVIVSRDAFDKTEGYTSFAYVAIADMAFKVYEAYGKDVIAHVPDVLYTAHLHEENATQRLFNEISIRQGHLKRSGIDDAEVKNLGNHCFKVIYPTDKQIKVSIVIVNKNNASEIYRCLEELIQVTKYQNYEVILVDQHSDVEDIDYIYREAQSLYDDKLTVHHYEEANYAAAVNYAVELASSEYITVLSPLTTTIDENWLTELMSLVVRDDVAVAGVRTVDEKHHIIHAGGVFGVTDDQNGLFVGSGLTDSGVMNRLLCVQEYTSVSSACFITTKQDFMAVDGLDDGVLSDSQFLIQDYCLKQIARHKNVLWTPYATVGQSTRQLEKVNPIGIEFSDSEEVKLTLLERWGELQRYDSGFNANLSLRESSMLPELDMLLDGDKHYKNKLRVMVYPFNYSGIGHYRVRAPFNLLSQQGRVEVIWMPNHEMKETAMHPSLFELNRLQPDVIYCHQLLGDEDYAFLQRVKRYTNIKVIFSIDDLLTDLPKKSNRYNMMAKDMRHRLRRVMALSDRVVVSTRPLADAFKDYHQDIVVMPNTLEADKWSGLTPTQSRKGAKLRVGWAGGEQHTGDLAIIADVVKELADRVDWVFMGMCPIELRPYVAEYYPGVNINDYPQQLADLDLDLALAPLEQHPFNDCKSNLRILEYGVLGWPVICSDTYPYAYQSPPVECVENTKQAWLAAIEGMLNNPQILKAQGQLLQNWVIQHYLLEPAIDDWMTAISV